MIETNYESYVDAPVGCFTVTGSSFVWCATSELCGVLLWGQQPEAETSRILHIFDQYDRHMAGSFGIILDTRGVERVEPGPLKLLYSWLVARRVELVPRIRVQASVIREGPIGFLLTGLLPVVGRTHPYRIFTEPSEAFRAVADKEAEALCAEVEGIADRVRGVPPELRSLRAHLASRLESTLDEVSRRLGVSPRSLQRILTRHGTSFHREVTEARFAVATELLRTSDQKLVAIGAQVGISERSLTLLFRAKTGLTPAEWRKAHRG